MKKIITLFVVIGASAAFAFPHTLEERVDDLEKQVSTLRKMVVELISDPEPDYDGVVRNGAFLYSVNSNVDKITTLSGTPTTDRKEFYIVEEISDGRKYFLLVRFKAGETPSVLNKEDTYIYKKN